MLNIIVVGIAGVALGTSAMSYINYKSNHSIEEKYAYLQRDVQQLTKEISTLKNEIEKQANASSNQKGITLAHTVKKSTITPDKYHNGLTSGNASLTKLEQQKLIVKEQARKKYLGKSMATN